MRKCLEVLVLSLGDETIIDNQVCPSPRTLDQGQQHDGGCTCRSSWHPFQTGCVERIVVICGLVIFTREGKYRCLNRSIRVNAQMRDGNAAPREVDTLMTAWTDSAGTTF